MQGTTRKLIIKYRKAKSAYEAAEVKSQAAPDDSQLAFELDLAFASYTMSAIEIAELLSSKERD